MPIYFYPSTYSGEMTPHYRPFFHSFCARDKCEKLGKIEERTVKYRGVGTLFV